MRPVAKRDILVIRHQPDGRAFAWDDVSGTELNVEMALKARMGEMGQVKKRGVYEKVREEACWADTGKGPIGARWIDVNKGGERNPEY